MLRKPHLWFYFTFFSLPSFSQTVNYQSVRVEKKTGASSGPAVVTVAGKAKKLAPHALAVWPVMNGENALVLVAPQNGQPAPKQPHLRFYEDATRKYRDLGATVLRSAALTEHKLADGSWAFVLAGNSDSEQPVVVVAGLHAVHGLIAGARDPEIQSDSLIYTPMQGGPRRSVALAALLAEHTDAIYSAPLGTGPYVQFQRDGRAVLEDSNTAFRTATWRTDGESMTITEQDGNQFTWPRKLLGPVDGIPAGTRLTVRLLEPLDSATAKTGDTVRAVLISPGTIRDRILIPQGSEFDGKLTRARGVGWAVPHC